MNKTLKMAMDFPMSTANNKLTKLMGNWNMKTLSLTSYVRAVNVWLRHLPEDINRKEKQIKARVVKKLD